VQDRHLDAAQPEDTGGPTRKTCLACGRAGNATHVCPSLFGGSGGLEHGVGGGGVPVASCQVHRRSCHVAIAASRCERERHGQLTRQGYWYCDNTGHGKRRGLQKNGRDAAPAKSLSTFAACPQLDVATLGHEQGSEGRVAVGRR